MPEYEKERRMKSPEEMLETVKLWNQVLGGSEIER